jgi:hypothetical protein
MTRGRNKMAASKPLFTFLQQPLKRYTFQVKGIRQWVEERCKGMWVLNLFAGPTRLEGCIEITNDLNTQFNTLYHMDALDCVKKLIVMGAQFHRIVLDPPYSYRKSMEMYEGNRNSRFKEICDLLPQLLVPGGKVITFGYHSIVMGASRGFQVEEICLISHGGAMRTTIATVEEKLEGDTVVCVETKMLP